MNKLHTINAEELQNRTYEPTHFLVDELIPEGLHILAGAPKIGKSFLVAQIAYHVSLLCGSACAFRRGSLSGILQ